VATAALPTSAPLPQARSVTEQIQRTADLRTAGYDKNAVRRMVRAGTLTRLCRGAYTDREPNDAHARHRLLVRAVLGELADGAVASHVSAAVVHGLPTWGCGSTALTSRSHGAQEDVATTGCTCTRLRWSRTTSS
jgi:putative AbiEi antitoxin of type IV toxin-antitoxin system